MPMLKKYTRKHTHTQEPKMGPKASTINAILGYSKSLEVKQINCKMVLLHLN
jgi:hypothetical protein